MAFAALLVAGVACGEPGQPGATPATRAGPVPTTTTEAPSARTGGTTRSGIFVPKVGTRSALLDDLVVDPVPAPVALLLGGAGINAPISAVGVDQRGELAVPANAAAVSWYRYGPSPGQDGSAVLAGHVDYNGQEGVFFRLGRVEPGQQVTVRYDDASERAFRVVGRRQVAKSDLPAADLFARDGAPRLVLITCGGQFDPRARSYRDNVVIEAEPI